MRNLSIRLKITLWFSAVLLVIVGLTFVAILSVSGSVMQRNIRDNLIKVVEHNMDEIEFSKQEAFEDDHDEKNYDEKERYIVYQSGYLEIDEDFLDSVNAVSSALYGEDGTLIYGKESQIAETKEYGFADAELQTLSVDGVTYYLFDREIKQDGLEGLWLRGIVSGEQGVTQLSTIVGVSLYLIPLLLLLAILGGYLIAGKSLSPIRKIEEAAAQIGKGQDLKKRIALTPGKDELHQLAETFNQMFSRLDDAFENERQFTSDLSHELRTPMSVIMAQCEYSLEKQQSGEEYKNALETIQRQGRKMSRLIDDMLQFVRLERKSDTILMETIDLSYLVLSISEDMALLKEQDILLTHQIDSGVYVKGNQELLSRLLTNLISNAYRYGKPNGFIKVTLHNEGETAALAVEDNGIGIAVEEISHIFDRFYQVDPSRSGRGTGLGLSMAQEIARIHEGMLSVKSEKGKGSLLLFTLKRIH